MPALTFDIEWPDGEVMNCYSPSTVIRDYFRGGTSMTVGDIMETCQVALGLASARVEHRFGFRCTEAEAQRDAILDKARCFGKHQMVRILEIHDPST
jgi:uncharacterized repeat protein (TIGR04042 family)